MKGIRGFRRIVLIVNLLLFGKLVLAQSPDEIVGKLMNEQNMFELRDKHSEHQQHLSPMINYFAEAMLAEAFNRPEKGIEAIDSLLSNEVLQQQLGLDNITYLIYLKANFLESQWRYSEETEMLSSFLSQTKELPIRNDLKTTLERYLRVASLLQNAPQTVMQRPQTDVIVKYEEEYFTKGLSLLIPSLLNGISIDMVLDTGNPKHTVVSAKLAKELNVTILVDSIPMRGVGNGYGKIGIADRLQIEEISIENPLLYVVDGISSIDTMPIDAVLGSEVWRIQDYTNI
jgi:predicted XRE-type DNA-binding protein